MKCFVFFIFYFGEPVISREFGKNAGQPGFFDIKDDFILENGNLGQQFAQNAAFFGFKQAVPYVIKVIKKCKGGGNVKFVMMRNVLYKKLSAFKDSEYLFHNYTVNLAGANLIDGAFVFQFAGASVTTIVMIADVSLATVTRRHGRTAATAENESGQRCRLPLSAGSFWGAAAGLAFVLMGGKNCLYQVKLCGIDNRGMLPRVLFITMGYHAFIQRIL